MKIRLINTSAQQFSARKTFEEMEASSKARAKFEKELRKPYLTPAREAALEKARAQKAKNYKVRKSKPKYRVLQDASTPLALLPKQRGRRVPKFKYTDAARQIPATAKELLTLA